MGLLDDAIREHLELRRLRGVDPSEVTHEELEALGSVHRARSTTHLDAVDHAKGSSVESEDDAIGDALSQPHPSYEGQETMELDMRSVLGIDAVELDGSAKLESPALTVGAAPSRSELEGAIAGGDPREAPLEWELPESRMQNAGELLLADRRAHRIIGAGARRAGEIAPAAADPLVDASSQERLWLDRQPAHEPGLRR